MKFGKGVPGLKKKTITLDLLADECYCETTPIKKQNKRTEIFLCSTFLSKSATKRYLKCLRYKNQFKIRTFFASQRKRL